MRSTVRAGGVLAQVAERWEFRNVPENTKSGRWSSEMSKTFAIAVSLALIGASAAAAQQGTKDGSYDPSATQSSPYLNNAPVGHRQPRLSDLPPETREAERPKVDPADAALDRKIRSICRGC
jgi:hypothetical protein